VVFDFDIYSSNGRAMAQAVSRWPLTAETRVRAGSAYVGFVVEKVALGQVSIRVLWFSPVNIIPPLLLTRLSVCDRSDQVALYHTFGPKLGASSLVRHSDGTEERRIFILFYFISFY
jgi:hypothetical protein